MPHAEVGVQNDPIHAIIAGAQEILIQSAQPICHGGYARRTPAYFKLPRRGHFFAARSAKKRRLFLPSISKRPPIPLAQEEAVLPWRPVQRKAKPSWAVSSTHPSAFAMARPAMMASATREAARPRSRTR